MSIKLLRHELLGVVLCLMGTDYINTANAQQTDQQTIVTKAEAALADKIKCRDFRKNANGTWTSGPKDEASVAENAKARSPPSLRRETRAAMQLGGLIRSRGFCPSSRTGRPRALAGSQTTIAQEALATDGSAVASKGLQTPAAVLAIRDWSPQVIDALFGIVQDATANPEVRRKAALKIAEFLLPKARQEGKSHPR
jgi:hypothetical protein